jgi:uncharacterized protein (TIGR00725 family)
VTASQPYIAVVGTGEEQEAHLRAAEVVGTELARAGAVVVCGGLGGVMAAACRGAREAGGMTIGLLPGDDRSAANPWVTVAIATGMGELRNALIVRAVDALVAVGGGFGTLSEIAFALRIGRPVVGVGTWDIGSGLISIDDPIAASRKAVELVTDPLQS